MDLYIVGDCPICPGSGDLIALMGKVDNKLLFYCPACETAWDKIPEKADEIKSLEDFAPEGVVCPSSNDIKAQGILQFEITTVYDSLDDII